VVETEKVQSYFLTSDRQKIGAMGTSAKVLMGRMNVRCDIEFDVIQSGILAAHRGFIVAILASGGMAERAIMKDQREEYQAFFEYSWKNLYKYKSHFISRRSKIEKNIDNRIYCFN